MNIIYFQSGGPTAVINSSLYGVIKKFQESKEIEHLYCSRFGIDGIFSDDLLEIEKDKDYSFLTKLPGSYTGSARIKLSDDFNDSKYQKILDIVSKYNIDAIIVNGGNDSMDTGMKLSRFFKAKSLNVKVFGIPKTIDNDLANCDFAPGFGSALNYIVQSVIDTRLDMNSYKKGRVVVLEVMGRDAGWLAASSVVASKYGLGPDLIYVSEISFNFDKFLNDVKKIYDEKGSALVVISEYLEDNEGNFIYHADKKDAFGHIQLDTALSSYLCNRVEEALGINTRYIVLNTLQRSSSKCISPFDSEVASKCGEIAISSALEGKDSAAISIKFDKDFNVNYVLEDFDKVANLIRKMPDSYINEDKNYITEDGLKYFEFFYDK